MREIKFRAWYPEGKIMYDWKEIMNWDMSTLSNGGLRKVIPLQYTGLHDKNGREIYEGDIVKGNPCTCSPSDEVVIRVVKYDNYGFYPFTYIEDQCTYDACSGCKFVYDAMDIEVIGNIYENPELIE